MSIATRNMKGETITKAIAARTNIGGAFQKQTDLVVRRAENVSRGLVPSRSREISLFT